MNINVSDEQMQLVVGEALLKTLTEENKNNLISEAIKYLLKPERGNYGYNKSPLQECYERAVYNIAQKIVSDKLENDTNVKTEIEKIYIEAFQKVFGADNRQNLVDRISNGISKALSER